MATMTMRSQHNPPSKLDIETKKVRVIGAGYSRTGTVSFSLAMEILLGGPVMHSGTASVVREEDFIKTWVETLNSTSPSLTKKNLTTLTAGYTAITDAPAVLFTGELSEIYPDAIVICSTRNAASWWKSFSAVAHTMLLWWLNAVFQVLPTLRYFGAWIQGLTFRHNLIYGGGKFYPIKEDHLSVHAAYLRRVVPKEKLFFFDLKEGWGPLCKILDVPVPDGGFPHENDQDAVQEFMMGFVKKAINRWLMIFAGVGALGWAVWRGSRS